MGIKPYVNAFVVCLRAFSTNPADGIIKSQGLHGVELITAVLRTCKMRSILCAKSKREGEEWTIVGITVFGCVPLQALRAHPSARPAWLEHTLPPWVCTFGQTVADPCINDPESHCDRCCNLWHMHLVSGRSILQRLWCASISCYL